MLAIGLTSSYVWYRAAQAQEHRERVMAGSKSSRVRVDRAAATTTAAPSPQALHVLPGSKSFILVEPTQAGAAPGAPPSTAPAPVTGGKVLFYGSKSAPVHFTPDAHGTPNTEPVTIIGTTAATTAPATTQSAR